MEEEPLARWYPSLQASFELGEKDISRLKRSLAAGKAPAAFYGSLALGRVSDRIPAPDLKEIVIGIAGMQSGYEVATEILHMRLHSAAERKEEIAPDFAEAGCQLILRRQFTRETREEYRLGSIAKSCLSGLRGASVATEVCRRLRAAAVKRETSAYSHQDLLLGLLSCQPAATLDGLCGGTDAELREGVKVLKDASIQSNVMAAAADNEVLDWCEQKPNVRYPALATVIGVFERAGESGPARWTTIQLSFLKKAPDPSAVLRAFVTRFRPHEWSGSLSTILESNENLLDQLEDFPELHSVVAQEKSRIRQMIDEQRSWEIKWNQPRHEGFE